MMGVFPVVNVSKNYSNTEKGCWQCVCIMGIRYQKFFQFCLK